MIELRDVAIEAGQFSLKRFSRSVKAGEYAVLMGQTGQGKTTILEAICGLRKITAGKILVRDVDVTERSPGDRGIGYVPQDLALFPTMTVQEHLEFALKLRRQSAEFIAGRVEELSKQLGIPHLLGRSIQGLSGGEAQRVALGRALSFKPRVLLLDEPFSALDENTRQEMHALMQDLTKNGTASEGVATLHVTHSSQEAAALADRRFVLKDGVIASSDSTV